MAQGEGLASTYRDQEWPRVRGGAGLYLPRPRMAQGEGLASTYLVQKWPRVRGLPLPLVVEPRLHQEWWDQQPFVK